MNILTSAMIILLAFFLVFNSAIEKNESIESCLLNIGEVVKGVENTGYFETFETTESSKIIDEYRNNCKKSIFINLQRKGINVTKEN